MQVDIYKAGKLCFARDAGRYLDAAHVSHWSLSLSLLWLCYVLVITKSITKMFVISRRNKMCDMRKIESFINGACGISVYTQVICACFSKSYCFPFLLLLFIFVNWTMKGGRRTHQHHLSESKLNRILEYSQRLQQQLDMPRIPVSEASKR